MDIEIIEKDIEKLESVVSCKIVLNDYGLIEEIHIVSNNTRGAKQIARDVQSVLLALYNIPVDYKKISIAQIGDERIKRQENRLRLLGVYHDTLGSKATVKVSLSNQDNIFENSITGVNASRNISRMLVDATLKTVEEACGYEDTFTLEDIRTTSISNDKAVIVVVSCLIDDQEKRFCGSCLINNNLEIAIVKATLDAVNRFITK